MLDEIEKSVLGIVGEYPMHIDKIAEQVNLEPGTASGVLMKMELKGIIHQLPGKMFVR
jgi:DNA processing protein